MHRLYPCFNSYDGDLVSWWQNFLDEVKRESDPKCFDDNVSAAQELGRILGEKYSAVLHLATAEGPCVEFMTEEDAAYFVLKFS